MAENPKQNRVQNVLYLNDEDEEDEADEAEPDQEGRKVMVSCPDISTSCFFFLFFSIKCKWSNNPNLLHFKRGGQGSIAFSQLQSPGFDHELRLLFRVGYQVLRVGFLQDPWFPSTSQNRWISCNKLPLGIKGVFPARAWYIPGISAASRAALIRINQLLNMKDIQCNHVNLSKRKKVRILIKLCSSNT